MDKLRFLSLASGSSGNCYFIGNARHGILIDAGIGVRTIRKTLKDCGYGLENILGIFVTHDHFDHIKSVGVLGEKYHVPVYSTQNVLDGINRNYGVTEKLYNCRRYIEIEKPFTIAEFEITAFQVSHDATESLGYCVKYKESYFTIATDLGYICENSAPHIKKANYLVLEANYDWEMLRNSRYPFFLRQRIFGNKGHMCNDDTATFLAQNYQPHLQYIYLCHLSRQNNTPEKAFNTVRSAMEATGVKIGFDVQLIVLPRNDASEYYIFD